MKKIILMLNMLVFSVSANAVEIQKLDTKVARSGLYVQQTEIPTVNILLTFKAGTIFEDGYSHGTANLVANLLTAGTEAQSAQQIQQSLEKLASNIAVYSSRDDIKIEVTALADNVEPTLQILQEILTSSVFPDRELKILKSSVLQAIRQQQESPGFLAMYTARKEFYGEDNVKAYVSSLGTEKSIAKITKQDLQRYFKNYITKENMTVSVVSSLDKQIMEVLLDKYLLPMHSGSAKELIKPTPVTQTNWARVEKDLPQTTVLLYTKGVSRVSPEYYTSVVFNYILGGGGFSSRLMEEIREKRGLTYGVRSAYEYDLPYPALFTVTLQTSNKQAYKVENLIRKELDKIGAKGVTQEELQSAKNFLVGSFPIRLRTSDKLLSYLDIMQKFDLPLDYLNTWTEKVGEITLEQVNEYAGTFADDEVSFARVFVGRM